MAGSIDKLAQIILPKGKGQRDGKSYSPTFNPRDEVLTVPRYREHLEDLFTTRSINDSRQLIDNLVNHDPDVSAAVHSYLTIAESAPLTISAYTAEGELDREGIKMAERILSNLTTTNDYSLGYSPKPSLSEMGTNLRYWILLRGMVAGELVLDKAYMPSEIRMVDPADLEWREAKPGQLRPIQKPTGADVEIDLNVPTFFTSRFHQSPNSAYTYSPFVAAINTVAARQDIINELYRIMQVVGYPRMDIKVLEEIISSNLPPEYQTDPKKKREFIEAEVQKIRATVAGMTARDAFVHSDAVEAQVINDKNPAAGLQIEKVIDVLDNQNQAALKVMPAVVGRSSSLNTASTEARLFALSCDGLNNAVCGFLSKVLTLAARLGGYPGKITVFTPPVELRPHLELEPQLTMRASRLKQDLSLGMITDDQYHMQMYGRPRPDTAPELSGTGFLEQQKVSVDETEVTPNSDPLGRSLNPEGSEGAQSNEVSRGEVGENA